MHHFFHHHASIWFISLVAVHPLISSRVRSDPRCARQKRKKAARGVRFKSGLGPALLMIVTSDSSRKPALATLAVLLTCRDAIARCDVAGNSYANSPSGSPLCRNHEHSSCRPIDMLFHLHKLARRCRYFPQWHVHVEDPTKEELLGNLPINWSATYGLRQRCLVSSSMR